MTLIQLISNKLKKIQQKNTSILIYKNKFTAINSIKILGTIVLLFIVFFSITNFNKINNEKNEK